MAKIVGLVGTGSGRVGNMVLSPRNGATVVRSYQPQVANPNTDQQRAVRATFKTLSQAAACVAPIIYPYAAIAKGTGMSVRNAFIKKNYSKVNVTVEESDNTHVIATAVITALDFTGSKAPTGGMVVERGLNNNSINISGKVLSKYLKGSVVVAQIGAASEAGIIFYGLRRYPIADNMSGDDGVQITLNSITAETLGASIIGVVWVEAPKDEVSTSQYADLVGDVATRSVEVDSVLRTLAGNMMYSRQILSIPTTSSGGNSKRVK